MSKKTAATPPKAKPAAITPAQAISEIRKLRAAKLFVTNMELVDLLLAEHDRLEEFNGQLLAGKVLLPRERIACNAADLPRPVPTASVPSVQSADSEKADKL